VPSEAKALYPALFDLTKLPRKGRAAMGVYTKARDLWAEFSATPEQIAAFWDWFKLFSRAAQIAAREQRNLNPPLPSQVYELWPQYLEWWQARQADLARRAVAEQRRREQPEPTGDDAPLRDRERLARYHPFKIRRPVLAVATD
jgi:hypothetical protein